MAKSIGSDFEIGFGNFFHRKRNNLLKKSILLSSGRDCIYYILKSLNLKSRVLLPSYLCNSMLVPFDELGVKYDFYNVDENLNIDITDLKKKIEKNTECVFVIHYFGVEQPKIRDIKEIFEKNNIKLVEDQVQSFLSSYPNVGNYVFNSYRKFLPVPDGAFLLGEFERKVKLSKSPKYVFKRFFGGLLKNFKFLKSYWRKIFIESEETYIDSYSRPAKMSNISKYLLNKLNFREIINIRRRNYLYLASKLESKLLYPNISKSVCPLGCPILVENRDEVRNFLISNKIYPPVHWDLPEEVKEFEDSYSISKRILTIPIDQRYNLKDMKRIVRVLNEIN